MLVRQLAAIFGVFIASIIVLAGALRAEDAAAPAEPPAAETSTTDEAPATETSAEETKE